MDTKDILGDLEKEALLSAIELRIGVLYMKQMQHTGHEHWLDQEKRLRHAARILGIKLSE